MIAWIALGLAVWMLVVLAAITLCAMAARAERRREMEAERAMRVTRAGGGPDPDELRRTG